MNLGKCSTSQEKYRILIADDEPIERAVVSKTIKNYFGEEMEIYEAVNGREAIEVFRSKDCQIALLDISMPGINGLEAAEEIRKENSACSIIFLTAYDEFDFVKRALRVRALDYLLKPSAKEELIMVLEEAVNLAGQKERKEQKPPAQPEGEREDEKQEVMKNQLFAEYIRGYIESHYMEDISLQDAAAQLNYSDVYFCKFFKQNFDKNFIMYLSELRVEKAKELLADMTVNIKEISQRVGFRDSGYFTKVFKRVTGVTPSEYRYGLL
ncbi:MAG: response regulator [Lachnospiraceae bacterium]|nr:response regulator [Lachnospiraceae bacterium]